MSDARELRARAMMKPARGQKRKQVKAPPLSDDELTGFIMLKSAAPDTFNKLMLNKKIKTAFDKTMAMKASAEG